VVVNQRNPWEHHDQIRSRYENYKGRHDQQVIRDSHDARYRNHWRDDQNDSRGGHYDNGRHGGRGNGYHHDNGHHGDKGDGDRGNGHRDHGDNQ